MKDVAVTHEYNGIISVIAWFDTALEAEQFIDRREKYDPVGVPAGRYGIDVGCLEVRT